MKLSITAETGRAHVAYLQTKLRAARRMVPTHLSELSLALVGDGDMSRLHKQFMNLPGPTDVLTFPLELDSRKRITAGEVVVCVPEARRRAKLAGTDVRRELLLYALHGMLHLSGFDDRTANQYHRMHQMEDDILRRIGVGPVFFASKAAAQVRKGRRRT
jgi:probable rRNA maturation factor